MEKDINIIVKEMIGISPGSQLEYIFDSISQVAPYIGKVITAYKIHRLEQRFKDHEERITNVERKLEVLSPEITEFIKSRIFPFVLEDLLNESQDEKIEFILNGFEKIVDKEFTNEDKIISYFDILRQLRVEELKSLFNYDEDYYQNAQEKRKNSDSFDESEIEKLMDGYYKYIDSRLSSFGLLSRNDIDAYNEIIDFIEDKIRIDSRNPFDINTKSRLKWTLENRLENYELTKFGLDFIDFILNRK